MIPLVALVLRLIPRKPHLPLHIPYIHNCIYGKQQVNTETDFVPLAIPASVPAKGTALRVLENAQDTNIRLGIRRTIDEFDIADFDGHTILEQILDDRAAVNGCAVSALEVENHVPRL